MSRSRKKKPSKPYRGYCTFPLIGADTRDEFQEAAEMFGDFADPVKRKRIFDKPRKYRFEIWLKLHGKPEYEIREAQITGEGVSRLLFERGNMTNTFLTREEIIELTSRKQPKKQAETLRKNGIPFFTNAAGYPVVSRSVLEGKPQKHKPDKPRWQPAV